MSNVHRVGQAIAAAILILLALTTAASAERRLAFVTGVNAYQNLSAEQQLKRAVSDAETVADALKGIGYQVTRLTSGVTLTGFLNAFGAFTRTIEPGDTVLFYFAGHGIGLEGTNYLIPGDIPPLGTGGESVVKKLALAEPDLIADIQARGARVTVLIIDACRDNPFPKAGTRSLGLARGLTTREPPQGVFSLYSAGSGQQALDSLAGEDRDPNSVFTRVFVQELKKPGVSLVDLGETVREEVARLAKTADHDQVPGVYNQIIGARRVMLAGLSAAVDPRAAAAESRPANLPVAPGPDRVAWDFVRDSQDPAVLKRFLTQFRDSPLRKDAEDRLAVLAEGERRKVAALPNNAAPLAPSAEAECDRLAASPADLSRPPALKGVSHLELDAASAVPACRAAVAASPRSPRLLYQLARSLDIGKQDAEATGLYRKAADLGSAIAMNNLGVMYAGGRGGLTRDDAEAARLFRRAADLGNPGGLFQLGHFYEAARGGLQKDDAEAARLYKRAADLDYGLGLSNWGRMLAGGRGGVQRDDVEAVRLYRRAAALNDPLGINNLGFMTAAGRGGLAQDDVEAVRLYRRAIELNSPSALTNLADMVEHGRGGLQQDPAEAARLLRRAADQNHAEAINRLGVFYANGRGGLAKDEAEAARQYRRAADLGHPAAMTNLGYLTSRGLGVPMSEPEAIRLYRRAADLGNALAMNNLGAMYAGGRGGLQRNDREAARLYRSAADLGNGLAASNLGILYEQGRGVPRDLAAARFWFGKAAELGHEGSRTRLMQLDRGQPRR